MFELTLPDMTCGHCVQAVTQTVQKLDAAAQVQCDLGQHGVRIETSLPRERVVQALALAGYAPEGPTQ
jgi:copper chaperone